MNARQIHTICKVQGPCFHARKNELALRQQVPDHDIAHVVLSTFEKYNNDDNIISILYYTCTWLWLCGHHSCLSIHMYIYIMGGCECQSNISLPVLPFKLCFSTENGGLASVHGALLLNSSVICSTLGFLKPSVPSVALQMKLSSQILMAFPNMAASNISEIKDQAPAVGRMLEWE